MYIILPFFCLLFLHIAQDLSSAPNFQYVGLTIYQSNIAIKLCDYSYPL